MNISTFFGNLNQARVPYVVVEGWMPLPNNKPPCIYMLTSALGSVVSIGNLQKLAGSRYMLPAESGETVAGEVPNQILEIYPKGQGHFPDRWESEMLNAPETHAELIRIPRSDVLALSIIYWMLYRENAWRDTPERRRTMDLFISERVGPAVPCADSSVPLYK